MKSKSIMPSEVEVRVDRVYQVISKILRNQEENILKLMLYPGFEYQYELEDKITSKPNNKDVIVSQDLITSLSLVVSQVHEDFFETYVWIRNMKIMKADGTMNILKGYPIESSGRLL